jgi:hypothetical protein
VALLTPAVEDDSDFVVDCKAGFFAADFLAGFVAADFVAADFLAGFVAADFLAGFVAADFVAADFLTGFFAADFLLVDVLAAGLVFFVAIFTPLARSAPSSSSPSRSPVSVAWLQ